MSYSKTPQSEAFKVVNVRTYFIITNFSFIYLFNLSSQSPNLETVNIPSNFVKVLANDAIDFRFDRPGKENN